MVAKTYFDRDLVTKTILVEITNTDASAQNIQMPQGKTSSEVRLWGDDTPAVVVGGVDAVAEVQTPEANQTITVTLNIQRWVNTANKAELEEVITGKKDDVLYLDLSLWKTTVFTDDPPIPGNPSALPVTDDIHDTGDKVLEIVVPYDFTGKKDVTVYRKHGDDPAAALDKLSARPSEGFTDGSFFADSANGKVYIYASKFSTYAIAYTAQTTTPSRPSSSGSSGYRWPFTDVKRTDNFYQAVKYAYDNKLMEGTSATTFDSQGELTRAMLATVLYRAAGSPKAEGAPEFEDTETDVWYSDAVVWASETQVLRGYGNGKFGPNDAVSKEMLNMVIARQKGEDPAWVGDPELAVPAQRWEIAAMLMDLSKK